MDLNQIFAAGVQNAQAKASELLRRPVEISLRGAQQSGWEAASGLDQLGLVVPVSYGGEVGGNAVLLLDPRYAALMAELMFENDPAELPGELTDLQMTAAAEALSQIVSAIGEGVSRATGRGIHLAAGDAAQAEGNGGAVARGQVKEGAIGIIECELKIGSHPPSRIVHVIPGSTASALVSGGAAPAAPEVTVGTAPAAPGQRVQVAQFGSFGSQGASAEQAAAPGNLDLLLDVPLEITVELGRANRRMRDVLALGPGSILELSKLAGESVDLLVNGKPIAKGEVVVIDENFAVRIVEILSREERIPGGL